MERSSEICASCHRLRRRTCSKLPRDLVVTATSNELIDLLIMIIPIIVRYVYYQLASRLLPDRLASGCPSLTTEVHMWLGPSLRHTHTCLSNNGLCSRKPRPDFFYVVLGAGPEFEHRVFKIYCTK
jgi:hypothetical protein